MIFFFEFKTGYKAAETTLNIDNALGPGTAKEAVQCSGGSSSANRTRALKIRIAVDSHWKLITTD